MSHAGVAEGEGAEAIEFVVWVVIAGADEDVLVVLTLELIVVCEVYGHCSLTSGDVTTLPPSPH